MVSQAPRLWKQLLQQLEACSSPSGDGQLNPEAVRPIYDTAKSLCDQPLMSKATWKKLVNETQVRVMW